MLSELTRAIYDSAAIDWQTAEKIVYTMLTFMERKLPPEDYDRMKAYLLGSAEYQLPDRSGYPGYAAEIPDQARGSGVK
jgi:6-phosphofructokinase